MTLLPTIGPRANVAVVGSAGGIGTAFVERLASYDNIGRIFTFSRVQVAPIAANVSNHFLDLGDESSIVEAVQIASANEPLDLVIVATGVLHLGRAIKPEKSLRELTATTLKDVLEVNTVGPAMVAKHFLPVMRRHRKTVFAALSARVGSINDNRLGGWLSYRMSKSALNMFIRTASIEQSRVNSTSVVVSLHPGTVRTPLSEPFTASYDDEKLFTPMEAATKLLGVINGLKQEDTGGFFAYDGSVIEY